MSETSPIQPEDPTWRGFAFDHELQIFALYLNDPLVVGAVYVVSMSFEATLYEPSVAYGMYWDYYTNATGDRR